MHLSISTILRFKIAFKRTGCNLMTPVCVMSNINNVKNNNDNNGPSYPPHGGCIECLGS